MIDPFFRLINDLPTPLRFLTIGAGCVIITSIRG